MLDFQLVNKEEFFRIQIEKRQDPGLRLDVPLVDTEEYNRIQTKPSKDQGLKLDVYW